jgi:hypothetical protein
VNLLINAKVSCLDKKRSPGGREYYQLENGIRVCAVPAQLMEFTDHLQ